VRADVGCKHRPASGVRPAALDGKDKERRRGNLNSPWGKHGNPSGPARQKIIDALKAQLR
jgi:hypothetical protein